MLLKLLTTRRHKEIEAVAFKKSLGNLTADTYEKEPFKKPLHQVVTDEIMSDEDYKYDSVFAKIFSPVSFNF